MQSKSPGLGEWPQKSLESLRVSGSSAEVCECCCAPDASLVLGQVG